MAGFQRNVPHPILVNRAYLATICMGSFFFVLIGSLLLFCCYLIVFGPIESALVSLPSVLKPNLAVSERLPDVFLMPSLLVENHKCDQAVSERPTHTAHQGPLAPHQPNTIQENKLKNPVGKEGRASR